MINKDIKSIKILLFNIIFLSLFKLKKINIKKIPTNGFKVIAILNNKKAILLLSIFSYCIKIMELA